MSKRSRKLFMTLTAIVIVALVVSGALYYVYLRPSGIVVKEVDGTYTLQGNLLTKNISNQPHFGDYSASTTITENGNSNYNLTETLSGSAFGIGTNPVGMAFALNLNVTGSLPYNIRPAGIQITIEPLNGSSSAFSYFTNGGILQYDQSGNVNVSTSLAANGNLSLSMLNDTGLNQGDTYYFSLFDAISETVGIPIQSNDTNGISITASLLGLSQPVSTTFYLYFKYIPSA